MLLSTLWCTFLFELQCSSFPDMCPGVGFLDHTAALFLVFWGTFILFSIVAASVYFSTSSVGGFPTSSPVFIICFSDFKIFFTLTFISRSLIMIWLGMDFAGLSWCGLTWNLLGVFAYRLMSFVKWEIFSQYFCKFFSACSSFSFAPVIWI